MNPHSHHSPTAHDNTASTGTGSGTTPPLQFTPLRTALRHELSPAAVLDSTAEIAPYMEERRNLFPGQGRLVVRPADTAEVVTTVRLCQQHGFCVVPQAGNTGTVGGGSPRSVDEVVLSVERMTALHELDAEEGTLTVAAGMTLAAAQEAAAQAGWYLPLSLPSQAECRIGGNLATNAGGLNVVRYGCARDLTLGLEVVLADGRIWSDLSGLRKDNSRYDLRNLFIGSEGTLGIITAAKLRLFPPPRRRRVALLALPSLEPALPLVRQLQAESGDAVVAAELMSAAALAMGQLLEQTPPTPIAAAPWYLLLELASPDPRADLDSGIAAVLAQAAAAGSILDSQQAADATDIARLWQLRTAIPDGQRYAGASIKQDISVRPSDLAHFLPQALAAVAAYDPAIRPCIFGHVGDGNLHFNLSQPEGADSAAFTAQQPHLNRIIHDLVIQFGGSIAAEHGVGQLRRAELARCADPLSAELMSRIKEALDPCGLFNPGKKLYAP
ncbi:hydroxyacid dehydrogenase [Halorhodospira abdelmalekii]|uniref:FAD-binding oxidoreductase n=1 Tax=Halorhodospira abdelmalekii TaxID=421629 RepID=UPI001902D3ED|nr:FAD-binding oxidoreductase [Halorhodospira abdelmalekii]MBK1735799.1 hydroxyacid dehydrogenase [Halorhodospira abdelmalekii]